MFVVSQLKQHDFQTASPTVKRRFCARIKPRRQAAIYAAAPFPCFPCRLKPVFRRPLTT